jgi:predicted GIY-YIG superfamily endonuclease
MSSGLLQEDSLYSALPYVRAAYGAIQTYVLLHDKPASSEQVCGRTSPNKYQRTVHQPITSNSVQTRWRPQDECFALVYLQEENERVAAMSLEERRKHKQQQRKEAAKAKKREEEAAEKEAAAAADNAAAKDKAGKKPAVSKRSVGM